MPSFYASLPLTPGLAGEARQVRMEEDEKSQGKDPQ
jgi:hypothetical protein